MKAQREHTELMQTNPSCCLSGIFTLRYYELCELITCSSVCLINVYAFLRTLLNNHLIKMEGFCASDKVEAVLSETSGCWLGTSTADSFQVRDQAMRDASVLRAPLCRSCEIRLGCPGGICSNDRDFILWSWRRRCRSRGMDCQINRWICTVTVLQSA